MNKRKNPNDRIHKIKKSDFLIDEIKEIAISDLKEFEKLQEEQINNNKNKLKELLKNKNIQKIECQILETFKHKKNLCTL